MGMAKLTIKNLLNKSCQVFAKTMVDIVLCRAIWSSQNICIPAVHTHQSESRIRVHFYDAPTHAYFILNSAHTMAREMDYSLNIISWITHPDCMCSRSLG